MVDLKKIGGNLGDGFSDKFAQYGKLAIIVAGFAFFFSSKTVRRILLLAIVAGGIAVYAIWFAGPRPDAADVAFLKEMGLEVRERGGGVTITAVNLPQPAVSGDVQPDDYIEEVNDQAVAKVRDIVHIAKGGSGGAFSRTAKLMVRTGGPTGSRREAVVELPGATDSSRTIGVSGKYLEWASGVIVTAVTTGTPADTKLKEGDIIQTVGSSSRNVRRVEDVEFEYAKTSPLNIQVLQSSLWSGSPLLASGSPATSAGPSVAVTLGPPGIIHGSMVNVRVTNYHSLKAYVYDGVLASSGQIAVVPSGGFADISVADGTTVFVLHEKLSVLDPRTGAKTPHPLYGNPRASQLVTPITSATTAIDFR